MAKGTIAIEEAVINPKSAEYMGRMMGYLEPGVNQDIAVARHTKRLSDIHDERLKAMDSEGVEYMLLSLTSSGCQGEHIVEVAEKMATESNNWLAEEGTQLTGVGFSSLRSNLSSKSRRIQRDLVLSPLYPCMTPFKLLENLHGLLKSLECLEG
jgi:hypothetical protein